MVEPGRPNSSSMRLANFPLQKITEGKRRKGKKEKDQRGRQTNLKPPEGHQSQQKKTAFKFRQNPKDSQGGTRQKKPRPYFKSKGPRRGRRKRIACSDLKIKTFCKSKIGGGEKRSGYSLRHEKKTFRKGKMGTRTSRGRREREANLGEERNERTKITTRERQIKPKTHREKGRDRYAPPMWIKN